jgi:radical SAM protein with 4Fe4S-binding SPASM domain
MKISSDSDTTESILYLSEDVVFVSGAIKGAIYDFKSGKVFWVGEEAQRAIIKYAGQSNIPADIVSYFNLLASKSLYDTSVAGKPYIISKLNFKKFETVWLEITSTCNERCLHCYNGQDHNTCLNSLTFENWDRVISQIEKIGAQRIIIIGGEPCTHPDIDKIILSVARTGIKTTFFTNATLLTDELIELIAQKSIEVKVSIYGHNAQTHDSITCTPSSFVSLNKNVKKLLSKGVIVTPSVVIMKENQNYVNEIRCSLESLGLKYTGYDVIREIYSGDQSLHIPINRMVLDKAFRTRPNFNITKTQFNTRLFYNGCWWGKIAVLANGDVTPCVFERTKICGNVLTSSVLSIIASDELKYCWEYNYAKVSECRSCEFRMACKDCRPIAMSINNRLESKSRRCLYSPAKGEWIEL